MEVWPRLIAPPPALATTPSRSEGTHARHADNAGTSSPAQAFFSRASAIRLTVTPPITTTAPTRTGSSGDSA